jgi:pilus assembly protein CpaB
MRTKSLVLLLLALGCGLIASIGISQVIERNRAGSGPAIEYEDIVVAAINLKENEKLKAQSVELKPFPKGTAPEGAYHSIEDVLKVTHRLRTVIAKGEAILPNRFLDPKFDETTRIPMGMRVVAIQADSQSAAGNLLKPDDRVDLLLHVPGNNQNQQAVVKTILRNIRVFSVNDNTRAVSETGEVAVEKNTRYVTLLVTPEQTRVVMLAQNQGQLKLSLRHPDEKDDAEDNNDIKNIGKVLTDNSTNKPNSVEAEDAALKPLARVENAASSFLNTLNAVAERAKENQPPVAPASAGSPPVMPYETFNMVIIENSTPRGVEMMRDKKNPKGTWVSDGIKGARMPRVAPAAAPTSTATSTLVDSLGLPTQPVDTSVKNTTF